MVRFPAGPWTSILARRRAALAPSAQWVRANIRPAHRLPSSAISFFASKSGLVANRLRWPFSRGTSPSGRRRVLVSRLKRRYGNLGAYAGRSAGARRGHPLGTQPCSSRHVRTWPVTFNLNLPLEGSDARQQTFAQACGPSTRAPTGSYGCASADAVDLNILASFRHLANSCPEERI